MTKRVLVGLAALRNVTINGTMPAAITKINGQDAAKAIEDANLQYANTQE
jgi:hypothetical protein